MALLDRETRPFHAEADQGWEGLLRGHGTLDAYVHQLTMTYGFELPFELACAHTSGLPDAINLRGRSRATLITQDLLALGCTADEVKAIQYCALAPFQDAAEALGWMYVVERPTLIHGRIRKELTRRFVELSRATTYLSAFEGYASKRRMELGIALDRLCVSSKVCGRVVDAARTGFQALIEWQRTNSPVLQNAG